MADLVPRIHRMAPIGEAAAPLIAQALLQRLITRAAANVTSRQSVMGGDNG